jgi:hypothetical protein
MKWPITRKPVAVFLLGVAAIGMLALATLQADTATTGSEDTAKLPEPVRKAFRSAFPGAKIARVEVEPQVLLIYEVDMIDKGQKRTVELFVNGEVLVVEKEVERPDLPKKIAEAISRETGKATVKELEQKEVRATIAIQRFDKPRIVYEVEYIANGKNMYMELDADGKVVEKSVAREDDDDDEDDNEREVSLKDIPKAARDTIVTQAGDNPILEVEEQTRRGGKVYEAEWRENGKEVEVTVSADGKLLGKQVGDDDDEDDDEDEDDD